MQTFVMVVPYNDNKMVTKPWMLAWDNPRTLCLLFSYEHDRFIAELKASH